MISLTQLRREGGPRAWPLAVAAALGVLGLAGCASPGSTSSGSSQARPRNVYCETAPLPGHLKRVAVLPLEPAVAEPVLQEGCEALQPILHAELMRRGQFQYVVVPPNQLRQWVGRTGLRAEEALPKDFWERIQKSLGCDAVLFCELTEYEPYLPVAVGWRLQLVAVDPVRVWWAVDEVFSGTDAVVIQAARRYYKDHLVSTPFPDPDDLLASPRRFGMYTVHAVADTMPKR